MIRPYKIADRIIRIESVYDRVHDYCRDYVYEGGDAPDIEVYITQEDIAFEVAQSEEPYRSMPEYLEELAVYRQIAEKMPYFDTFLFHGSAIAVDNEAYLFTAKSGTGKSTHSRLWCDLLGDKAVMVNDDKPLIRSAENKTIIYGTPYNGKHRRGSNIAVPLKAICVLKRGEENKIRKITKDEVFPYLLQQTYRPADKTAYLLTIKALDRLTHNVAFYMLECNMDISAAEVSYNYMRRQGNED